MEELVDQRRNPAVVEESVQHANGLKPKIRAFLDRHAIGKEG